MDTKPKPNFRRGVPSDPHHPWCAMWWGGSLCTCDEVHQAFVGAIKQRENNRW
jgi:hypothetical protein